MPLYKMAEFSAIKAKRVLNILLGNILNAPGINTIFFFKISESEASPILLYRREIWRTEIMALVEHVHMYAYKRFLNSSDIGRYPIYIFASCK